MRRRPSHTLSTIAVAIASAVALTPPAAAQARHVIAPPGNSGVEQYVEVVPSAEGNLPVNGSGTGHGAALPKTTRQRLEASGAEGRAAASFARSTGAAPSAHHRKGGGGSAHSKGSAGGGGSGGGSGSGGSPPPIGPAVQSAAQTGSGGGGLGAGLPIALGAIALIAAAAFLIRRRAG